MNLIRRLVLRIQIRALEITQEEVMTAKHTPGPWFVRNNSICNEKEVVAIALGIVHSDGDHKSNCRLIAAAPELLDALVAIMDKYVGLVESGDAGNWDAEKENEVIASRAAISKATGSAA